MIQKTMSSILILDKQNQKYCSIDDTISSDFNPQLPFLGNSISSFYFFYVCLASYSGVSSPIAITTFQLYLFCSSRAILGTKELYNWSELFLQEAIT